MIKNRKRIKHVMVVLAIMAVIVAVVSVLKYRGDKEALRLIAELKSNQNGFIRRDAVRALGRMRWRTKMALPGIRRAMEDPDEYVRHEARILLMKVGEGRQVLLSSFGDSIVECRFSPDNKTLLRAAKQGKVYFWRVSDNRSWIHAEDPEITQIQAHEGHLFALGLLVEDETYLLTVGTDSLGQASAGAIELHIYPFSNGTPAEPTVIALDASLPEVAAFSNNGRALVTWGHGQFKLWDVKAGRESHLLARPPVNRPRALVFSRDGKQLAAAVSGSVVLWDTTTGEIAKEFPELTLSPWCLAFSPDGKLLATGSKEGDEGLVQLWNVSTELLLSEYRWRNNGISSLAFSPKGSLLAVGSGEWPGQVKFFQITQDRTFDEVATLVGDRSVRPLAFSPDGRLLAGGSRYVNMTLWNVPEQEASQ